MDSARHSNWHPRNNIYESYELDLLFSIASKRFDEASMLQPRNEDVSYYAIETIGDKIYYSIALVKSYVELIERKNPDTIEVLIPSVMADVASPLIEQIDNNSNAYLIVREYNSNNRKPKHTYISPRVIGLFDDNTPNHMESRGELAEDLIEKINNYELIPSNVPARRAPTELIFKKMGIKPASA